MIDLGDVRDSQICLFSWVVSNLCHVESNTEVTYSDMIDVDFVLVECSSNFRGVAVRAVYAVMPIAEITRGRVEIRRLEVCVLSHVCHLLSVVLELLMVGALAACAMAPRVENQFRVGVVGHGRLEFA